MILFNLPNGKKLKQWTLDNVLICDSLTVGTLVYFCNDIHTITPLKTKVYEKTFIRPSGIEEIHKVCDVPNILVTIDRNINISLDGADWFYSFDVDCAVRPKDYVYIETVTELGNVNGVASTEQIEAAVKTYIEQNGITGGSTPVDNEFSESSTNALSNSAITSRFKKIETDIGNIDALLGTI